MVNRLTCTVADEAAMIALAPELAATLDLPAVITLSGELGAGKSVLARALIHYFGYEGSVKSPTYSIVETYCVNGLAIAHLDLYRIVDPEELHFIGFDDVLAEHDLVLIEWPEQGGDRLPHADLAISIRYAGSLVREVSVRRPALDFASIDR